jgi:hypothetical protein
MMGHSNDDACGRSTMIRRRAIFVQLLRWLTLTLAGLLAYALARALLTLINLGISLYDWQWYVWLVVLTTVLPAYLALRLPRNGTARAAFGAALMLACIGYNGFGQVKQLRPNPSKTIALSFWSFSDLRQYPGSVLRDLREAGGNLYMGLTTEALASERDLAAGIKRLGDYGIGVYLVPPVSDFLSVPVHGEWISSTHEVMAFVTRKRLSNVRGVIGDAEAPRHTPLDLPGTGRTSFQEATLGLRRLIQEAHQDRHGLQVGITASWLQYADALDGDSDVALTMRSPVDPPGGWGFVNLMTYSSYFPADWQAYYVYIHEHAMAVRYPGKNVSHLIGLVGGGFPWEPLLEFSSLVRDARLSRAEGVNEVVVFQLEGVLRQFGDDFVRRFSTAVNGRGTAETITVPFSRPASALLYGVSVADALLDVRGLPGLLWLLWAMLSAVLVRRLA